MQTVSWSYRLVSLKDCVRLNYMLVLCRVVERLELRYSAVHLRIALSSERGLWRIWISCLVSFLLLNDSWLGIGSYRDLTAAHSVLVSQAQLASATRELAPSAAQLRK